MSYPDFWKLTDTSMSEIWLNGFIEANKDPAEVLAPLARSWQQAPEMTLVNQFPAVVYGYDIGQRAYLADVGPASMPVDIQLRIAASNEQPVINPTFLINNWGDKEALLEINGTAVPRGPDFRIGYYSTLDVEDGREWNNVLVVWAKASSTESTVFRIRAGDASPVEAAPALHAVVEAMGNTMEDGSVTFSLSVPEPSDVSIRVLDTRSETVGAITTGFLAAGDHEINWTPPDGLSGMYLYELKAWDKKKTGKLMFMDP
jgi:hypothetical protein